MEAMIIESDLLTPRIVLNPEENKFEISERSMPEDALAFYMPVIHWLEEYKSSPNPKTQFEFKLEYFNTASSRMLYKVFSALKEISDNSEVTVRWYYKKDDTDMLASGKRFDQLIDTPFEFIEN